MNEIPIPTDEQRFIPLADFEILQHQITELTEEKSRIIEERNQLRAALEKIGAGIHKASDMIEGVAWTYDNKLITNLAFELAKSHPKQLTMKYKGEMIVEISQEI